MSRLYKLLFFYILCCCSLLSAQSTHWWSDDQEYYKFLIDSDGVYRINYSDLATAGLPVDRLRGDQIRLYSYGEEIRIYSSTSGELTSDDYILFWATANDGRLDAQLYSDPAAQQLNPSYSLYTDDRPYYLSWREEPSDLRYAEVNDGLDSPGLPPIEEYYIHHYSQQYQEFHHKPSYNGRDFIRYSHFDTGEGYGTKLSNSTTLKVPLDGLSDFGIDPVLRLRLGTNVLSRSLRIYVNDQLIKNVVASGYRVVQIEERFPFEILNSDTAYIQIEGINSTDEKHTVSELDFSYPRAYEDNDEEYLRVEQQASIISRLVEIEAGSMSQPTVLNLTAGTIMEPSIVFDRIRFITPAAFSTQEWILFDQESGIRDIDQLQSVSFDSIDTAPYTILTHGDLMDHAALYADYRSSAAGGGYQTTIVDIADLYEQYAYGVQGHPVAIKAFLSDLDSLPQYLFMVGKGLEYTEYRDHSDEVVLPTWGIPGSDNLLTSAWGETVSDIAIGRLAAQSPAEIMDYLRKIQLHESPVSTPQTIEGQSWKKSIVHLSGGSSNIQNQLYNYLNNMGDVISNNTYGGNIQTFRKTSSDPIQTARSEEIIQRINQGAALISFFGHSAVGTFDFSLEDPSKYDNKGKNPVILSLGCHSGNIHTSNRGISEDFVLEPDRGSTHFIASSGTAYINPQYNVGMKMYEYLGEELYGAPIGMITHRVLEDMAIEDRIEIQTLVQQLTLHGDPAYRLRTFEGPDYVVDPSTVQLHPTVINSTTDYFTLDFDVVNLGLKSDEAIEVLVVHQYDDVSDTISVILPAPAYDDHLTVEIDNPGYSAVGQNHLEIIIDPSNEVAELPNTDAEENNRYISADGTEGYSFYILDNTATPIYPDDYAILNSSSDLTLKSAVNNAFDPGGEFVLQIDTTATFSSPLMKQERIENQSSIFNWRPFDSYSEGVVYYWRIAPLENNALLKADRWQTSSFIYLADSDLGWSQSHYYQWLDDTYHTLSMDSSSREIRYADRLWDIRIKNKIKDANDFWVFVNNSPWKSLNPKELAPGIAIFAWHRDEVIVTNESGSDFGSIPFSPDGFVFKTDTPTDRENIKKLLESIPDGARVFIHTLIENEETTLNIEDWEGDTEIYGTNLFEVLASYGSVRVNELKTKGAVPFTMIFDKGKGLVIEDVADQIEGTIDLSSVGTSTWNKGQLESVRIGPARRWKELVYDDSTNDQDIAAINLYGIGLNGKRNLLRENITSPSLNISSILPEEYPYLVLEYAHEDIDRTAPQLHHWRVLHSTLPDAALYSMVNDPFRLQDTINAGEDLMVDFDILNLGLAPLDPVLVRYVLTDPEGQQTVFVKRAESVSALDSIHFSEIIKTDGLGGYYQLSIELNPGEEQPEITTVNNFGVTDIFIRPDEKNPFLDVTFDRRHIQNGYLSGTTPEIMISLHDPDSYVLLDDAEDFDITIYYPEFLVRRISADDPDVEFIPATDISENIATFIIRPNLNVEGEYTLQVNAKDKAGNKAGDLNYQVTFVIDDSIAEEPFSVYPNPTEGPVEFQFFLGERIPDIFYMRIYTSTGQEVHRADREDFGGLYYGVNRYIWDGRDQKGQILSNGVYFYEFINNEERKEDKKKGRIVIMK